MWFAFGDVSVGCRLKLYKSLNVLEVILSYITNVMHDHSRKNLYVKSKKVVVVGFFLLLFFVFLHTLNICVFKVWLIVKLFVCLSVSLPIQKLSAFVCVGYEKKMKCNNEIKVLHQVLF